MLEHFSKASLPSVTVASYARMETIGVVVVVAVVEDDDVPTFFSKTINNNKNNRYKFSQQKKTHNKELTKLKSILLILIKNYYMKLEPKSQYEYENLNSQEKKRREKEEKGMFMLDRHSFLSRFHSSSRMKRKQSKTKMNDSFILFVLGTNERSIQQKLLTNKHTEIQKKLRRF